jgi:hypothetical protein
MPSTLLERWTSEKAAVATTAYTAKGTSSRFHGTGRAESHAMATSLASLAPSPAVVA